MTDEQFLEFIRTSRALHEVLTARIENLTARVEALEISNIDDLKKKLEQLGDVELEKFGKAAI
jgi:hypothetical protein